MNKATKARGTKLFCAITSVVVSFAICPLQAFAASELWIDDGSGTSAQYTKAANGVGSGGGTWDWDGGDALELDSYQGSAIYAKGDLDIDLSGDNVVTDKQVGSIDADAICVEGGDLTIEGDGTLEANSESEEGWSSGIYAIDGDVTIDDATVVVNASSSGYNADGISSNGGDVNIVNGANVTATADAEQWARGICVYNGDANIVDSTVRASGTSRIADGYNGWGDGIEAYGYETDTSASRVVNVNITNSTVNAEGSNAAILVHAYGVTGSSINIANSVIKTPSDARVQDVVIDYGEGRLLYGQTIGTGTETITDLGSGDYVKSVSISTVDASPTPVPVAPVLGTMNHAPITGDSSNSGLLAVLALMVAGVAFAGAGFSDRRRGAMSAISPTE